MGSYVPLFRLAVAHDFFADGICRHLGFVAAGQTARAVRNAQLVIRNTDGGLGIFCDEDRLADLRSETGAQAIALSFIACSSDPHFVQYTAAPVADAQRLLVFDSRRAVPGEDGRGRLHAAECAGESDLQDVASPELAGIVDRAALLARPAFVVTFAVGDGDLRDVADYSLRFAARSSYWKYYIDGDLSSRELAIVDLDGREDFTQAGTERLRGRPSHVFRSGKAIPMQERHTQRFQLKERGTFGEKVVVKRLPNASVNRIGMETIDGKAALVSEMYIG
ncbi:hypothetical protein [Oxalicibacterium solurbis]|uniref:Uncharacterized protein n=1 Tax=Oxalicibacterium solurbis TaxID=69280 RepID=A0A8J3AVA0_9BURK|nr:hypothetical protein [Oxalicibacterium solurbis]GGI52871.1 hypothetical protein GCM10011430_00450 [Oxalicibacterium solurbis]